MSTKLTHNFPIMFSACAVTRPCYKEDQEKVDSWVTASLVITTSLWQLLCPPLLASWFWVWLMRVPFLAIWGWRSDEWLHVSALLLAQLKGDVVRFCKSSHTCQVAKKPNEVVASAPFYPIPTKSEGWWTVWAHYLVRSWAAIFFFITVMCASTRSPEVFLVL